MPRQWGNSTLNLRTEVHYADPQEGHTLRTSLSYDGQPVGEWSSHGDPTPTRSVNSNDGQEHRREDYAQQDQAGYHTVEDIKSMDKNHFTRSEHSVGLYSGGLYNWGDSRMSPNGDYFQAKRSRYTMGPPGSYR